MKPEVAKILVDALRSGEYAQGDILISVEEAKQLAEWFAKAAAILENKKDSGSC